MAKPKIIIITKEDLSILNRFDEKLLMPEEKIRSIWNQIQQVPNYSVN